jgi:hypothetical protein
MTVDIALLYNDLALGRWIVPPHSVYVRPVPVRWDPRVPLGLENCVVGEIKEASRAMSRVFAMPDADAMYEDPLGPNRAHGYVDTLWRADRSRSVQEWGRYLELRGGVGRRGCSCPAVSYCADTAVS